MAPSGTDAYLDESELPPLVARAVAVARRHLFPYSSRPEQGRLLHALADGARTRIAETGTGYGVGLAWLASGAPPGVELISVERDPERAAAAAEVFADLPNVRVLCGDWRELYGRGPYDLLVLDGGGTAKGDGAAEPQRLLTVGGLLVVDDFTPSTNWPPTYRGQPDQARLHWLNHPHLRTVELPLAPDLSAVVGVRSPHNP